MERMTDPQKRPLGQSFWRTTPMTSLLTALVALQSAAQSDATCLKLSQLS
jgi:hypothetical protein